jgi:hypothetical protein
LKLKCDEPLSNFAFNFNLRRYIAESGAWKFGFWDHPDLAAEIVTAVERGGPILVVLPPGSTEDLPREGVNLGPLMDAWYDAYFGFASPSSMETERALGVGACTRPLFWG